MITNRSPLRRLTTGDLVYYKLSNKGEACVNKTRVGIIVELAKKTAMGFQMICVMWNDTGQVECIAENYLHKIDET